MLEAIEGASQSIRLEVYAFAFDAVGERFVTALSAAARRGVRVTVVLDGWGSVPSGREVAERLRDAGCQVAIHNPLVTLLLGRFSRNHRKVLLVDESVAFLGGINIGDAYGTIGEPDAPHWLDLAVELRGGPVPWLAGRLGGQRRPPPAGQVRVHVAGLRGGRRLRKRYLKAIGGARRSVVIAHAYFLPDLRLVRSLTAAARRGVAVKLILPGRSDVPLARAATRSLYGRLLRAGIDIHEWTQTVLHAKAAVVDRRRVLVGSFNLDPFSLSNLETLVEVDDPSLGEEAAGWMERVTSRSAPVTLDELAARPRLARWALDALGLLVLRFAQRLGRLLALR